MTAAFAPARLPVWDSVSLAALVDSLAGLAAHTGDGTNGCGADRELLTQLGELERVKAAVAAAQVRVTVGFATGRQRAADAARFAALGQGFESWRAARGLGSGIGEQVGLARGFSPWQGVAQLSFATALSADLPCTLAVMPGGSGLSDLPRGPWHTRPRRRGRG